MPNDDEPREPFGAEIVRQMRESRLAAARSQYEAGINRLWAGCGGGLIGVVTVLRQRSDPFFWLSVASFGVGVLILGIGAFLALLSARTAIRHLEEIEGLLDMKPKYWNRLSDEAGLSPWHPQTFTALTATGLFILGVIFAGIVVLRY